MSYTPIKQPYLVRSVKFPIGEPEFEAILTKTYTETAIAVNNRTIGLFDRFQMTTGERWYNDEETLERRQSYRRVYTGTGTPVNFNHEISGISQPVRLFGMAYDDTTWYPLPFVSTTATDQIGLSVNSTQILFDVGGTAPTITEWFVVLEYILS